MGRCRIASPPRAACRQSETGFREACRARLLGLQKCYSCYLLDRRLAFVRPFRLTICKKLLEHGKTHFAVIQCVTELPAFVNPRRWYPRERQAGKLFDLVFAAARSCIREDCYI